jgi:hypothetical protein
MRFVSMLFACIVVGAVSYSSADYYSPVVDWTRPLPVLDAAGPAIVLPISYGQAYAVAGTCGISSQDAGDALIFLLQADSYGNMLLNSIYTTFSTPSLGTHEVHAFQPLLDGGFVIAGTRKMNTHIPTHDNGWVICTGSNGAVRWTKVFGTIQGNQEQNYLINAAQVLVDGTIIVAGQKVDKAWVCCLGLAGDVKWSKTFDADQAVSLTTAPSGEVIAACVTSNTTRSTINLLWLDAKGNTVTASQPVECPAKNVNVPIVLPLYNMNTVFSVVNSCTGVCQIMSYDQQASFLWERDLSFNGFRFPDMGLSTFIPFGTKAYIASGALTTGPNGSSQGMWLARVGRLGDAEWQWSTLSAQNALSIAIVNTNDLIVLAQCDNTANSLMLMKISQEGPQSATAAAFPQPATGVIAHNSVATAGERQGKVFDVLGRSLPSAASVSREMLFCRKQVDGRTTVAPLQLIGR